MRAVLQVALKSAAVARARPAQAAGAGEQRRRERRGTRWCSVGHRAVGQDRVAAVRVAEPTTTPRALDDCHMRSLHQNAVLVTSTEMLCLPEIAVRRLTFQHYNGVICHRSCTSTRSAVHPYRGVSGCSGGCPVRPAGA